MLVVPEPGTHEPFWDEEAASLIAGITLYVAFTAAAGERHLGAVRQRSMAEQAGETGRRLLLADEVRRMEAGRQVLAGRRP